MNALIGHLGIAFGLLCSLLGCGYVLSGLNWKSDALCRRGSQYAYLPVVGALISTIAIEHALITHDFSLAFVAGNNSRQTPLLYSITGMWSALQGSILLWVLVLTGYIAVMVRRFRKFADDRLFAVALAITLVVAIFFFALMLGPADPFAANHVVVSNGSGPNPLLQDNLLIAFHPVFLYLGYVGFTIPFAFAIGSLVTGRVGEGWLVATRRFTVFAWAFLTVGIVLGAWWSYQSLGWGGAWGWDPVENVALLPWLTATAYLHSVMVQERRGMLRIWNLSLLVATFSLTILGTFLTRSGVVVSVHTFSDSGTGPALLTFFAVIVLGSVGLIGWRGDLLRSPGSIDSPVSREGAFLVNNLLFAGFAFVVLLGTVFPLFVEAVSGNVISIGRPYFDTFTVPLGLALLFFMAIAPALPWRKAGPGVMRTRLALPAWAGLAVVIGCLIGGIRGLTPLAAFGLGGFAASSAVRQLVLAARLSHRHGFGWQRGLLGRANGGMVAHLGIIVIAVALTASSSFAARDVLTLVKGATASFDHHRFTFLGWQEVKSPNEAGYLAKIAIDHNAVFRPGIVNFDGSPASTAVPSIDSSVEDDVYLALASGAGPGLPVSLDVIVQPLVLWLWVGGGLTAAGAVLAALPGRRRRPTDPSNVPIPELLPPPKVLLEAR